MAENYWDWKFLVSNLMVFSLPCASYIYARPVILNNTLKCWFKYAWIIFLILLPFLRSDAFGRYLVPFTLLALFLPFLNKKYLLLTIAAYLITITLGSASRSDMLKFSVCLILGISLFLARYKWYNKKTFSMIVYLFLFIPFIFFTLGVTNTFNIFKIEEELGLEDKYTLANSKGTEYSALIDTRTFLYAEEISSAINNNYVILGRSIARGYDSAAFGKGADKIMDLKRGERQGCETSILNIFNHFGIVGVILYLFIFWKATYLAINKSRNIFVPIIGLYVAFRWMFAWIEDFSRFDLNYLFLWIFIGICYSPIYRNMTNKEFKSWLYRIIQ